MALRLSAVRPGEHRNAWGAFAILFGTMIGHSLLETARDALFLAKFDAARLPFVYLGIAALALVISNAQKGARPAQTRARLSVWLCGAAGITAGFWLLVMRGWEWSLYALYIWSGLLSTLLIVRFWILAGGLFSVTQAKRLFALIGTGSILGAIAGSALAKLLVTMAPVPMLLLAAAGAFGLSGLLPGILQGGPAPPPSRRRRETVDVFAADENAWSTLRGIWSHPYVRRVGALVLVSTVTLTFVDFAFKTAVAREVQAEDLGDAFALTYLILNAGSLVLQVTVVGWMTRNLSVERVLGLLPLLLLPGSLWLALGGAFYAALLAKTMDGFFRHSLLRTATEVLYVPLSGQWRSRVKSFIDVTGQRGGQALASLGFLAIANLAAPEATPAITGGLVLALAIGWIVLAFSIKRHYFDLFRKTLQGEFIQTRIDFPEMDLASLETLMEALSSPDEGEVKAALDLLAETDRLNLAPSLILYHPSASVVVRALELFRRCGRTNHHRAAEGLLDHPDGGVRAAALVALPAGEADMERFESALSDESADVRATALVGLIASKSEVHPRVRSIVETLMVAGSAEAKVALARAIRHRPEPQFDGILRTLAASGEPMVACEVARAMRESPKESWVPSLLSLLRARGSREEARLALVAIGPKALERLAESLEDSSLDPQIRRHVPRTIARFDPEPASLILMRHLPGEQDGVTRFKILRALGQLRAREPGLRLDANVLGASVERTLESIFHVLHWKIILDRGSRSNPEWDTPVRRLILELLEHKRELALERLFRLFSLQYAREDFRRIHRGLRSKDRDVAASSRELLEHLLVSPVREAVLGLVDDVSDGEKLAAGARFFRPEPGSPIDVLRTLLEQRSVHLRCLVAYHVAETGLTDLRDDLSVLCEEAVDAMESSFRSSLELLENPETEKAFVVRVG